MKEPLLIYGAGGLGKEVLSWTRSMDEFELVGFIDDNIDKGTLVHGLKVLGRLDVLNAFSTGINLVIAVGDPAAKSRLIKMIDSEQVHYPVLQHPSAIVQDKASIKIGKGCIITAGCILTTDIKIGSHVLINLNTTVGHDVEIGTCSSIMTGVNVAGGVKLGEGVLLGSGCNILNGVTIGNFSKVGMGAVVIHNVEELSTVVGVPARKICK